MRTGSTADPSTPLAHQPALDGIRAVAVGAVILFHGSVTWASAGFFGVDIFFVLSGFLITYLLLREITTTGRVAVKAFWLRRARRLLPALVLVLLVVAVYGATLATDQEALGLRGDLLGSLFYVQNWRLVLSGNAYFAQFGSPSPLRHMWSLAIEEQWYLIWPLAFLGITKLARRRVPVIAGIVLGLAAASAVWMAVLQGNDGSRAYYGTDTRAQALLLGAALAVVFSARPGPRTRTGSVIVQTTGVAGALFLAWVITQQSESWDRLYQGGFTLVALATAAVIAAAMIPGPLRFVLSVPPLPQIGLISYGLYLWHWPVFVWLSPERSGLVGQRLLLARVAVTLVIAIASYVLVERPIRSQRFRFVRGRVAWVPATAVVATVAILGLTATGAAARPRPNAMTAAEIRKKFLGPPRAGATRVLLTGDSIAFTLAFAGPPPSDAGLIWVRSETKIGCGLLTGVMYSNGKRGANQNDCGDWPKRFAQGRAESHPDVAVMLTGGWEIYDREVHGKRYHASTPAMERLLRTELDRAARILTRDGARLVLLTAPCFDAHDRNLGTWGEAERADPSRLVWLNDVLRRYAADHLGVDIVDLAGYVCPNGTPRREIHGVQLRADGEHYTFKGARLVWHWLAPRLHAVDASQP